MLTWLFGGGGHATGVVLLVLVNVLAFGYGVALIKLARFEGMSDETARRAVWLLALAPPAFVLVMGYTEALAGLLAIIIFYGLRSGKLVARGRRRAALGAVPAARGAARWCRRSSRSGDRARSLVPWMPRMAALIAPVVGRRRLPELRRHQLRRPAAAALGAAEPAAARQAHQPDHADPPRRLRRRRSRARHHAAPAVAGALPCSC